MSNLRNSALGSLQFAMALFTAAAAAFDAAAQDQNETGRLGIVEGSVIFRGKIPKSKMADTSGEYPDLIEVDPKTRGLKEAVVFLMPVDSQTDARPPGDTKAVPANATALVDQLGDRFVPRVLAVREGQEVTFTNSDAANHNVRSATSRSENQFNIFVGTGGTYRRKFHAQVQCRPIELGCDIHPWMRGWIYVFDHPFFAVTDEQGRFKIPSVPPGECKAFIVQPDLSYRSEKTVIVKQGDTASLDVTIEAK